MCVYVWTINPCKQRDSGLCKLARNANVEQNYTFATFSSGRLKKILQKNVSLLFLRIVFQKSRHAEFASDRIRHCPVSLAHWQFVNSTGQCNSDQIEKEMHLIFSCSCYNEHRVKMINDLKKNKKNIRYSLLGPAWKSAQRRICFNYLPWSMLLENR